MTRFRIRGLSLYVPLVLAAACTSSASTPPPQTAATPNERLSSAEFPDYDVDIWRVQSNGLALKAARARLTREPDSPEITELLLQNQVDAALRRLRLIVAAHPHQMPRAFEIVAAEWSRFNDEARGYPAAIQDLIDAARAQLPTLPREEAARVERQLLVIDRRPYLVKPDKQPRFADLLTAFARQYAGTPTALLTEVDVIELGLPIRERLQALDAFVRDHPGTVAAAKALQVKAFHLSSGNVYPEIEARGADPINRFFQVVEIVKELESGRYPPCEWVERAPTLIAYFFAHNPVYAAGSVERLLDAYLAFAKTHFTVGEQYPLNTAADYVITTKMFDLFKLKGQGVAGVERVFTELERDMPDVAAVRYLRAVFYIRSMNWEPELRATYLQKALDSLTRLQAEGTGLYHRKALAALASLYFSEGDYRPARDHFGKYLGAYSQTAWAWVAALRIGQCSDALNEWAAGVDAHRAAASTYASVPLARVLGHAYAARGYEALGQFNRAAAEYQSALAQWDADYGPVYSLHGALSREARRRRPNRDDPAVARDALSGVIARLQTSLAAPGGSLFERGRWLLDHGRHDAALVRFEQVTARHPRSPVAAETRYLANRARLGKALALADVANPRRNDAAALAQLRRVSGVPYDFAVCAARIASASIVVKKGAIAEAEAMMRTALAAWRDHQRAARQPLRDGIERDVADVRSVVIGARRNPVPPFVIVNPKIAVRFADGRTTRLTIEHAIPGVDDEIFLNDEQQRILNDIVALVGGTPSEQTEGIDILGLWTRFLPAERRLGGMIVDDRPRARLETSPVIAELEFLNAERTKAAARVVMGHRGATIVLEKQRGIWTVKASVNNWISYIHVEKTDHG